MVLGDILNNIVDQSVIDVVMVKIKVVLVFPFQDFHNTSPGAAKPDLVPVIHENGFDLIVGQGVGISPVVFIASEGFRVLK